PNRATRAPSAPVTSKGVETPPPALSRLGGAIANPVEVLAVSRRSPCGGAGNWWLSSICDEPPRILLGSASGHDRRVHREQVPHPPTAWRGWHGRRLRGGARGHWTAGGGEGNSERRPGEARSGRPTLPPGGEGCRRDRDAAHRPDPRHRQGPSAIHAVHGHG